MTVNSREQALSNPDDDRPGARTPAPKPAPRRRGRPSRRDAILQAAVELFAKGGSRGTCIAAIAERIGVTPPAVIHHFKTKDALLAEVVAVIDERRVDLDFRVEESRGPDRLTHLGALGERLEANGELANLQRLATVMVAEALDPDHPRHDYFVGRHREFRALVAETLRIGVVEGWVRDDVDPEVGAVIVVGALQGIQIQWFLDPDRVPIHAATESFIRLLVTALAPATDSEAPADVGAPA
jgi:AcrR family transcriptional regulator